MEANAGKPSVRSQGDGRSALNGIRSRLDGTWLGRNWGTVLILGAIMIVALFVRIYYGYSIAVDNGFLVAGGSDSYYHMRVIDYVESTGHHLVFDDLLNYPIGVRNMRPPMYDWSVAVTSMVLSGISGMSIADSTGYTLLYSTAFWGALTVIPLFLITRAAFGNTAGLLASLLYAVMPGNITRSVFGYADHDAFLLFFVVFGLYFLLRALMTINGTKWVSNWKDLTSVRSGVKKYMSTNRRSLIYAMLGGVCLATIAMAWTGYTYMLIIVLVYFLVQVLINRFRNVDSMAEFFVVGAMLLTGFAVIAPLYWQMGYWFQWFDVPFYLFIGAMVVGGLFMVTRDYPWTLVIPGVAALIVVALVAVFFIAPNIFEAIVSGQGYLVKSKLYSTIAEASAPTFSYLVMSIGIVTFWLAIAGLVWAVVKIPKNTQPYFVFIVVWMGVSMYMAVSASRFLFNASPAFAMAGGWILALLIGMFKFEALPRAFSGFRSNPLGTLRKGVKVRHVVGVLVLVFMILLPNVWLALDSGIPSETKTDYDLEIYNAIPNALHPPGYDTQNGTLWYLGAFSYSFPLPTTYYPAAWSWYAQQDTQLEVRDRPAYLSWWDYGFEAVQQGQHPTVSDNFQNAFQYAGSFLTAQNESDAVALFIVRSLEQSGFNESIRAIINENGGNASAVQDIMENPEDYVQTVLDNPQIYGNYTEDLTPTNAKYAAARVQLEQAGMDNLVEMNHQMRALTGNDIGYVAVDSRLFPFSATSNNIFYAPAKLSDRYIDPTTNAPTDYYTIKAVLSDYSTVPVNEVTSTDTVIGYQIFYTDLFYETMIYRTLMGVSPTDVGKTSQGIPGISGSMTSYDAMPGYNLTHFRQVYRTAYFNPYNSSEASNHSDAWRAISWEEAKYLQSQISAGTMSGTVDMTASSLQAGVVFIQYYDGAPLSGVATSNDGAPLAGIHVTVVDEAGIPHQTVETASDGSYDVLLPFGNASVVFSVGDLNGATLVGSEMDRLTFNVSYAQAMRTENFTANGDIVLPAAKVTGSVFWDVNGDGRLGAGDVVIPGANVTLVNNRTSFTSTVVSDANGTFTIMAMPGETNDLYASLNGHDFGWQTLATEKFQIINRNIAIRPASVSGTLSFQSGGAAVGVGVSITDDVNNEVINTTTGAGGAFAFDRLLPGNYTVSTTDQNLSATTQKVTLKAGEARTVTLTMQEATQVSGQVTSGGTPMANVAVGFISASRQLFANTGADGRYSITVPQGNYTVFSLTSGGGIDQVAMVPLIANADTATVDLALSPGSVVTGKVMDGSTAVSSADVVYTKADGAFLTAATNSTGDYRLVLPAGDYFVYASGSGKALWTTLSVTGTATQDLTLQSSASISGKTWYDSNGNGQFDSSEGLGNVVLEVRSTSTPSQRVYFASTSAGNYNISLPTGSGYQLTASLNGYSSVQKTYDPFQENTVENIQMVPLNRTVTGTVTLNGVPLNSITVQLIANGGGAQSATVTTGPAGGFTASLRPGVYTIKVNQNVTTGDDTSRYEFSGPLVVEVGKDPAAQAVAVTQKVKVTVGITMGSSATGSIRFVGPQNTTATATSTLTEYLTPGTYTVYTQTLENGTRRSDLRSVVVNAPTTISIAPTDAFALTGQLQYDGSNLGVPAAITITSGTASLPTTASGQGSFTTYLPNGTYVVTASYDTKATVDSKPRYIAYNASQTVTVSGEATVDIPLTRSLNNATISGTLTGASSGVAWNLVALSDTAMDATASSGAGSYSFNLAPGTYSAYGVDGGNNVYLGIITVNANTATTTNLTLENGIPVSGTVTYNGTAVSGALVTFSDNAQATDTTGGGGAYLIYLPSGTYNVSAVWTNQEVPGVNVTYSRSFNLAVSGPVTQNIDLVRQITGVVEVSWNGAQKQTIDAGKSVTYDVTITNRGNVDDTYQLSTDSSWNVTFSENDIYLPWGSGSSRTVQVTVVTPADAKVVHSPVIITASSLNHTGAEDSATLEIGINPTYQVNVSLGSPQTVDNSTVSYPFQVTNRGNAQDSYNFTITNAGQLAVAGWNARIAGTSGDYRVITVSAGSSQTVNVLLTKAQDSSDMNATVQVTATSTNATASSTQNIQTTTLDLPDGSLVVSGEGITMGVPEVPAATWALAAMVGILSVIVVVLRVNKGVFGRRRKR